MRQPLIIKHTSLLVCVMIIMNLFAGSMLCLVAVNDCGRDFYEDNERNQSSDELELIKIPVGAAYLTSENFQRLNDHEMMYHHKLYDVVKQYVKGDFHYYYCVNDSKEEKILEQVKECLEANLGYIKTTDHAASGFFKFFTQNNFSIQENKKNLPTLDFVFSFLIENKVQNVLLKKLNPPPDILFS